MRVIQFEDKDAKHLLDQLELAKFQGPNAFDRVELQNVPDHVVEAATKAIHRRFHYVVVNWLQDQGATTTG